MDVSIDRRHVRYALASSNDRRKNERRKSEGGENETRQHKQG